MVVPDRGLRRKAYSAHYDYGMDATQIHRELLPAYSLCTVERLLREFKLAFSVMRTSASWHEILSIGTPLIKVLKNTFLAPELFQLYQSRPGTTGNFGLNLFERRAVDTTR